MKSPGVSVNPNRNVVDHQEASAIFNFKRKASGYEPFNLLLRQQNDSHFSSVDDDWSVDVILVEDMQLIWSCND